MSTKAAISLLPRTLSAPLFLVGPTLSVMLVRHMAGTHYLPGAAVTPAIITVLAMWSPSPISIPALVMQDVRDSYGAQMRGITGTLKRGVLITFWLVNKNSPVRVEMQASLLGFAAGVLFALH